MKNKYFKTKLALVMIVAGSLMSYQTGTPGFKSGAPGEGSCGEIGCHGVQTPVSQQIITSDIPSTGYMPDSTYTITVAPEMTGVNKYGFELVGVKAGGNAAGKFTGTSDVSVFSSSTRATHKLASTAGSGGRTWTVDWTAPTQGTGSVHFYVSVIAANGDVTNGGDILMQDDVAYEESGVASVSSLSAPDILLYPNPCVNEIHLLGNFESNATIEIYDISGALIVSQTATNKLDVSGLAKGNYILNIINDKTRINKRFTKS